MVESDVSEAAGYCLAAALRAAGIDTQIERWVTMGQQDPYAVIGSRLNWDAPEGAIRCRMCPALGKPTAGSYSSALSHYEEILGSLEGPRSRVRVLVLFQDPRPMEQHFRISPPREGLNSRDKSTHRYFCLSPVAWEALGLAAETRSMAPVWPTEGTAYAYLRRYVGGRDWSYDGFVTYFLYRLRVEDALVTNAAKCHFSKEMVSIAAKACVKAHLIQEARIFKPNLILSFSTAATRAVAAAGEGLVTTPVLQLPHPAAWRPKGQERCDRVVERVSAEANVLQELGVDPQEFLNAWKADVTRLMSSSA